MSKVIVPVVLILAIQVSVDAVTLCESLLKSLVPGLQTATGGGAVVALDRSQSLSHL